MPGVTAHNLNLDNKIIQVLITTGVIEVYRALGAVFVNVVSAPNQCIGFPGLPGGRH